MIFMLPSFLVFIKIKRDYAQAELSGSQTDITETFKVLRITRFCQEALTIIIYLIGYMGLMDFIMCMAAVIFIRYFMFEKYK